MLGPHYNSFNKKYTEQVRNGDSRFHKDKWNRDSIDNLYFNNEKNQVQRYYDLSERTQTPKTLQYSKNLYYDKTKDKNFSQDYLNYVNDRLEYEKNKNNINFNDENTYKYFNEINNHNFDNMSEQELKEFQQYKFRKKIQPKIFGQKSQYDLTEEIQSFHNDRMKFYLELKYAQDRDYNRKGMDHQRLNEKVFKKQPLIVSSPKYKTIEKQALINKHMPIGEEGLPKENDLTYHADYIYKQQNLKNHYNVNLLPNKDKIHNNQIWYKEFYRNRLKDFEKHKQNAIEEKTKQEVQSVVFRQKCLDVNETFNREKVQDKILNPFNYSGTQNIQEMHKSQVAIINDNYQKRKLQERNSNAQKKQLFEKNYDNFNVQYNTDIE